MVKIVVNKFKVKEYMSHKRLSNFTELAKALGISKNQLSNILSNKYNPIKVNITELADFLGVNPLEILHTDENEKVEGKNE